MSHYRDQELRTEVAYEDDDCEDQGMMPTTECVKFECQWWEGAIRKRPKLVMRGKFWCCPKCGASYGETP